MSICAYEKAVCRTPAFSLVTDLKDVWDELKNYIFWSSPSFYDLIKNLDYTDLKHSSAKTQFTVWKYFNRSKFRSTPFGHFGSITPVALARDPNTETLKLAVSVTSTFLNDWSLIDEDVAVATVDFVKSNSSFYFKGEEIRYLCRSEFGFQLSAIDNNEAVSSLLAFCASGRLVNEVRLFLESYMDVDEIDSFLQEIIDLNLVITDKHSNSIGQDYFKRLKISTKVNDKKYIISERKLLSGVFPESRIETLSEFFQILPSLSVTNECPHLIKFRNQFLQKYEYRAVSLMEALDPEIGIGYGNFEQEIDRDDLVSALYEIGSDKQPLYGHKVSCTSISRGILNRILASEPINLAEVLSNLKEKASNKFPNTFSALVELVDENLILKNIAVQNGVSLLGRFTLINGEVRDMTRELAQIEETSNPNVIFFDIGYQGEKNVDNVNRRDWIYQYELPVLEWSENKKCIDMNDLYVVVDDSEIILFSKTLGKRLVPRFATAYNYVRSDLALFRFLTDLQHQNLNSDLGVDIQRMFPELDYYPRVTYKNVIISTEKWLVPSHLTKQRLNSIDAIGGLKIWLEERKVSKYFKCGIGDQTLVFSTESDTDLKFFMIYIANKNSLYIEECLIPENPIVRDNKDRPYNSEFVVSFFDRERKYRPYDGQWLKYKMNDKTYYLPGNKWFYYEIYCHPFRSNEILIKLLKPFVNSNKEYIKRWFFIRFNNPANHLRFRMEIDEGCNTDLLIKRFNESAHSWLKAKSISDIQLKTYFPEIERYGIGRMDLVEQIFHKDSSLIVELLSETNEVHDLYCVAVMFMESMLYHAGLTRAQQKNLIKSTADQYAQKKINGQGFKLLNKSFIDFYKRRTVFMLNEKLIQKVSRLTKMVGGLIENTDDEVKWQLISDLFHMHVNRLFPTDAVMHETIIYQFLHKILLREEKTSKLGAVIQNS